MTLLKHHNKLLDCGKAIIMKTETHFSNNQHSPHLQICNKKFNFEMASFLK